MNIKSKLTQKASYKKFLGINGKNEKVYEDEYTPFNILLKEENKEITTKTGDRIVSKGNCLFVEKLKIEDEIKYNDVRYKLINIITYTDKYGNILAYGGDLE